jgi:hypothetical protein
MACGLDALSSRLGQFERGWAQDRMRQVPGVCRFFKKTFFKKTVAEIRFDV